MKKIFLFFLMLIFFPTVSWSSIYYVAKTGNNGNVGSLASPWLTIQYGVNQLVSGDILYVRTGTYNEMVELNYVDRNFTSLTTIENYTGESPIVDGNGLGSGISGFYSGRYGSQRRTAINYVKIKGFEIKRFADSGIRFENDGGGAQNTPESVTGLGSHDITIENCIAHTNGTNGILFEGGHEDASGESYNITVKNCTAYSNTGIDHGIKFTGGTEGILNKTHIKNSTIEGCISYLNQSRGIHISTGNYDITVKNNTCYSNGEEGISLNEVWGTSGGGYTVVEHNEVYDNGTSSENRHGIVAYADGVKIRYNKIYSNAHAGISIYGTLSGKTEGNWIYNNLIYNNLDTLEGASSQAGLVIETTQPTRAYNNTFYNNGDDSNGREIYVTTDDGHQIKNNIMYRTFANGVLIKVSDTGAGWTTNDINYNLYYAPASSTPWSWGTSYYATLALWRTGTGNKMDLNSPTPADPSFVSAGTDFHLQSSSPAKDAGDPNTGTYGITDDYAGVSRPKGAGYDIGAYEFITGSLTIGGGSQTITIGGGSQTITW